MLDGITAAVLTQCELEGRRGSAFLSLEGEDCAAVMQAFEPVLQSLDLIGAEVEYKQLAQQPKQSGAREFLYT